VKKILTIILVFTFTTSLKAETWSCIYSYNNETRTYELKRVAGKSFARVNNGKTDSYKMKIVKETNKYIHLYESIGSFETAFLTILDKKNTAFVMVGLEYKNSTAIIEGKCIVK
jgi:menaquinone-dependent protoporphyrinogen IX oxidase